MPIVNSIYLWCFKMSSNRIMLFCECAWDLAKTPSRGEVFLFSTTFFAKCLTNLAWTAYWYLGSYFKEKIDLSLTVFSMKVTLIFWSWVEKVLFFAKNESHLSGSWAAGAGGGKGGPLPRAFVFGIGGTLIVWGGSGGGTGSWVIGWVFGGDGIFWAAFNYLSLPPNVPEPS